MNASKVCTRLQSEVHDDQPGDAAQVGIQEVRPSHSNLFQISSQQKGFGERCIVEVSSAEIGFTQIGMVQVSVAQVSSAWSSWV